MKSSTLKVLFCLYSIMSLMIISCGRRVNETGEIDKDLEITRVEKTIRNNIGWAGNKDFDLLRSTILLDSTYLVVNPTERVDIGVEDFLETEEFFRNPDFQAVGFEISDLRISFSCDGKVAWFYCHLNDWNTLKGQPANWENTRWTGVLEKIEGAWKIRQMHFSFPE